MKNILKTLANSVLIPLGLRAVAASNAAIQNTILESGIHLLHLTNWTKLIIWNDEMYDMEKNDVFNMKIFKSLEESDVLIKDVIETIKNWPKNPIKSGFHGKLLVTLAGNVWKDVFTGKKVT